MSSRRYRIQPLDKKMEWVSVLAYHMLVVAGVALTAAGSAKLQEHEHPLDKAEKIAKAGIAILAVAWGIVVAWTSFSLVASRGRNSSLTRAGTVVCTKPPGVYSCYANVTNSYLQPSPSRLLSLVSESSTVSLRCARRRRRLIPSRGRWLSVWCWDSCQR
jgi:hypothetical protein